MDNNVLPEIPEQRLTRDLLRIRTESKEGFLDSDARASLFDSLLNYCREIDCVPQTMTIQDPRFSDHASESCHNVQLSLLMEMLHTVQLRLRERASELAERLEVNGTVRQANASYGGVVHRELSTHTQQTIRYQT